MSTYQELIKEKEKQEEMLRKKHEKFIEFKQASQRILEDLNKRIEEVREQFRNEVREILSGLDVGVNVGKNYLNVVVWEENGRNQGTVSILEYGGKGIKSQFLKTETVEQIIKLYKDTYSID